MVISFSVWQHPVSFKLFPREVHALCFKKVLYLQIHRETVQFLEQNNKLSSQWSWSVFYGIFKWESECSVRCRKPVRSNGIVWWTFAGSDSRHTFIAGSCFVSQRTGWSITGDFYLPTEYRQVLKTIVMVILVYILCHKFYLEPVIDAVIKSS